MMRDFKQYRERLRLRDAGGPGIEATDKPVWFVFTPVSLPHPNDLKDTEVSVKIYNHRHLRAERITGNVHGPFWSRETAAASRAGCSDHALVYSMSLGRACGIALTLTLDEFVDEVRFWAGDERTIEWEFGNLPKCMQALVFERCSWDDDGLTGSNRKLLVSYDTNDCAWTIWDTSIDPYTEGAEKKGKSLGQLWAQECDIEPLDWFADHFGVSGTTVDHTNLETLQLFRRAVEARLIEFTDDWGREWRLTPKKVEAAHE